MFQDDCFDSGTGTGGTVHIQHSIIENCLHEGIALSNVEVGQVAGVHIIADDVASDHKRVRVEHCIVAFCQQGVELGFSSAGLFVTILRSILSHNVVAVRYGDGYGWQAAGFLFVEQVAFAHNAIDWLNRNPAGKGRPHPGMRTAFANCFFSATLTSDVLVSHAYLWDNFVWWTSDRLNLHLLLETTNRSVVGPRAMFVAHALPEDIDLSA